MTLRIALTGSPVHVAAEPLTSEAFASFGSVVQNPRPDLQPSAASSSSSSSSSAALLPRGAASANQGHAIQYRHASQVRDLYAERAPSRTASGPVVSVFVCAARPLSPQGTFTVRVLERHPFTTQMFSPLVSSADTYLVIVAPTLATSGADGTGASYSSAVLSSGGLPDLRHLRAFVASGKQAVTYGAGTWHAPMVVLGREGTTLDFVVTQFANGVPDEDCQVVEYEGDGCVDIRVSLKAPTTTSSSKL